MLWGKVQINRDYSGCNLALLNPFLYRGYVYDYETKLYYLQSRYYDPETGRFLNPDEQINCGNLGTNLLAYCENSPIIKVDSNGRRTYFINGINNDSSSGIPEYAQKFAKELIKMGVKDVRTYGVYKGKSGFWGTIKGVVKVSLEMLNINIYTNDIINAINQDLLLDPLKANEQLNLIGYSGGGQIALNVMKKMNGLITNVVLIGTPVMETWNTTTQISLIYAGFDPLSWAIGWGFKSYFAGWIGHTDYFNSKNINKVAKIVAKIIN